jgi:transcription initiation factor IIE alpha subunit
MEMIFRCPNCGKKLDSYDNKDIIKALSDKIEELEKEAPE